MTGTVLRRDEQAQQFELVEDGRVVSVMGYERRASTTVLLYTATPPEARHQGHATALVEAVLADLRARSEPYAAGCPFVRAYLAGHPEGQAPAAGPGTAPGPATA